MINPIIINFFFSLYATFRYTRCISSKVSTGAFEEFFEGALEGVLEGVSKTIG